MEEIRVFARVQDGPVFKIVVVPDGDQFRINDQVVDESSFVSLLSGASVAPVDEIVIGLRHENALHAFLAGLLAAGVRLVDRIIEEMVDFTSDVTKMLVRCMAEVTDPRSLSTQVQRVTCHTTGIQVRLSRAGFGQTTLDSATT